MNTVDATGKADRLSRSMWASFGAFCFLFLFLSLAGFGGCVCSAPIKANRSDVVFALPPLLLYE